MSGLAPKSGALTFKLCKPINRKAKPKINSPIDLRWLLLEKKSGMAKANIGSANAAISILKPKAEMIQAVTVVPILAPMMTPIDWPNVSKPAFTKLTTITVVAEDDWIRAVIKTPVSMPVTRLVVIAVKIRRNRSPANFCKPSLMVFMP